MVEIIAVAAVAVVVIAYRYVDSQKRRKEGLKLWESSGGGGWRSIRFDTMTGAGSGGNRFEVRRTNEGQWESRIPRDVMRSKLDELQKELLGPRSVARLFAEEEFKELSGMEWAYWEKRVKALDAIDSALPSSERHLLTEKVLRDFPETGHQEPQWKKVADEYAPSIEAAYQRYIHQG